MLMPATLMRMIRLYCLDAVTLQKVGVRFGGSVIGTEMRVDQAFGKPSAAEEDFCESREPLESILAEIEDVERWRKVSGSESAPSGRLCYQEVAFKVCASSFMTSSLRRTGPFSVKSTWPGNLLK